MSTSSPERPAPRQTRLSLFWKILLASFVAGLLPLILIAIRSVVAIQQTGQTAQDVAANELDTKSIDALTVRAQQTTLNISKLLRDSVQDTLYVARLEPDADSYMNYYTTRTGELWYETGTADAPVEVTENVPLYREMAYVDASGHEVLRIVEGELVSEDALRNVADPANTTYKTETYFAEAGALPVGEVYVSPVMAWYVTLAAQPARALDVDTSRFEYHKYEAVVRYATPVREADGKLKGVVVLSLDYRHVMELVDHIQSTSGNVVWPDLASGNYAYLLDYEGWLIAHADMATMRGLDENGMLMPTRTKATGDQLLPFNMITSDQKPTANTIANAVLAGKSDYLRSLNRQGALKVDIYVPIHFEYGVYKANGYFGGLVLSENVLNVEKAGEISRSIIQGAVSKVLWDVSWIVGLSIIFLIAAAVILSRNINQPISKLTDSARLMEKGELDVDALDQLMERRLEDEVTDLTRVFKQMAEAVQLREKRLREEVQMLRIQIDERKKAEEVERITESETFKDLQARAQVLRQRRKDRVAGLTSNE
jgi:HAMP domain-containing protein